MVKRIRIQKVEVPEESSFKAQARLEDQRNKELHEAEEKERAQKAIDDYITNRKAYGVAKEARRKARDRGDNLEFRKWDSEVKRLDIEANFR
jgi:hypothetical protein